AVPALVDATQRSFLAVCCLQQEPLAQAMDMAATVGGTPPTLGRLGMMQAPPHGPIGIVHKQPRSWLHACSRCDDGGQGWSIAAMGAEPIGALVATLRVPVLQTQSLCHLPAIERGIDVLVRVPLA